MWLDCANVPLKWHYPFGVLFDLLGSPTELPWLLTVHFQGFPTAKLLRCSSDVTVKNHYMNVIKEANFLKHGDSYKINSLSRDEQNDLWEGLITRQLNIFWKVNANLFPAMDYLQSLAIRLVRKDRPYLQEPVSALDSQGQERTLGDVLHQMLPEAFAGADPLPGSKALPIVTIQGVNPPLNTPILWLGEHFSHPDNFLYVIVKEL